MDRDDNVRSMLSVIGEALVDLVGATDHQTFVAHCGGSPLNVAVGLARLDRPTALMARLGADAFGRQLHGYAADNGIDMSAAVNAEQPTTLAVVTLDEQARATYDFWIDGTADWQWTAAELDRLPAETTILHTGSLASWTSPGSGAITALTGRLRAGGEVLLSYDPNVRPRLLGSPARGRDLVEASVAIAHIVKASDEDIAWLYPHLDADGVAARWLALGAELVVITAGPDGASAYRGERIRRRAGRVITLVDTVGAGDAFMSGLIDALDRRGIDAPQSLAALDDDVVLDAILDDAILVAALTCEQAGANPPTRAQVDARAAS